MTLTNGASASSYNITPKEQQPSRFSHLNGTTEEILARYCITELCKAWPVYRDASEWLNYREAFTDDAYVFTTWSGGLAIDEFVQVSKDGRSRGDFIMHRENGTLAAVNLAKDRGLGKMKATITQRFMLDGVPCDVECDCRFIFFCINTSQGWKTKWVKLFYEKDKVVAVDGKTAPHFPEEELKQYPEGYQYLSVAQARLGHKILKNLPTLNNEAFIKMNQAMEDWLHGEDVNLIWND